MRDALRRDLVGALKARDAARVSALRSALAALENAEAVTAGDDPATASVHVAGAATGVGATEAPRRELSATEAEAILRGEIAERHHAAEVADRLGHAARAEQLRAEAAVLERYVE